LAITKLVDTIFDSGENLAVPWHVYNIKPLRLLLVVKVASLLDEDTVKLFWSCLMDKDHNRCYKKFYEVLNVILGRVSRLPDSRSRELISEALKWAIDNPETIHLYSKTRAFKYAHLPNMAVFPELLRGIENKWKQWDQPPLNIVHDRQVQFGTSLKKLHELCSNAGPGSIQIWPGEKIDIRRVPKSNFAILSSEQSAGIQLTDVILWLFKRIHDGESLPENCANFMDSVLRMAHLYDLSLESIIREGSNLFTQLENTPLSDEQLRNGHKLLQESEKRRNINMRNYIKTKLLSSS
jgi:hypothetical protein